MSSAPSFKSSQKITIVLCSHASGTHNHPLFVIWKSQNSEHSIFMFYQSATKACMYDDKFFKDWFINKFVPKVENLNMPITAVLVLENSLPTTGHESCPWSYPYRT